MLFKRKLHYVVIGGWLPEYLENHKITKRLLKGFDKIYVETSMMKSKLENQGFKNILVMPNFKHIKIVENEKKQFTKPYNFCTFSRVMYEKGIEHAAKVIQKINSEANEIICTLDIYGSIDDSYADEFNKLLLEYSSCVTYKGCVPAEMSTETIRNYYGLLFPTFYSGEGFAGTLIDAFSAGVPVIASDWRYNTEIVEDMKNGLICKHNSLESLELSIKLLIDKKELYDEMVKECLESAQKYLPDKVIKVLSEQIEC
jgi:glycosyltransferase involved in cell wall biosynthesis